MFSILSYTEIIIFATFYLSSANDLNLVASSRSCRLVELNKYADLFKGASNKMNDTNLQFLFGKVRKSLQEKEIILVNPLTDDKILDWSKLKQIADNILNEK